ncbi:Helix-turn-helix [Butyrivibrio fibrisolvens 16/4]|nr:Helix-turn-helix [Butyrivibrio fibrisolvens 16/4]
MDKSIIPQRLAQARENLGITKAEASRRLNLSKIGYGRYESGDRTPSIQTLEVIAQCFGTSVAYLTGETDEINPDKVVITKMNSPELFNLILSVSECDDAFIRRISTYASQLLKDTKEDSAPS